MEVRGRKGNGGLKRGGMGNGKGGSNSSVGWVGVSCRPLVTTRQSRPPPNAPDHSCCGDLHS